MGGVCDRRVGEERSRCVADEGATVGLERVDELIDLVQSNRLLQPGVAIWIQIVRVDEDALFACRDREGPNASHDVADCLAGLEFGDEELVFGFEAGVPEDAREVEVEKSVVFAEFDLCSFA